MRPKPCAHGGQRRLHGVERTLDRALDLLAEALPGDLAQLGARIAVERELRQRVVHHGADAGACALARRGEEPLHGGGIGHVGLQRDGARAQLLGQRQRGGLTAVVVDDDACALARQRAGDRLAQPAGAAGDQHPLFG